MFIACDNVLRWLSQVYHNPPPLSWPETDSERCTSGVDVKQRISFKISFLSSLSLATR